MVFFGYALRIKESYRERNRTWRKAVTETKTELLREMLIRATVH